MTETSKDLQKTPLYQAHVALGARMAPFGGWLMPIQYEGILAEHAYTRTQVTVFDICHMGEFMLQADPVSSGLDRIVTQKISSMPEGSCRYGFILNDQGGIIDDLIVYRLAKDSWMIVVNAATISSDYKHIKDNLNKGVLFEDVSKKTAKLDVQGPLSGQALVKLFGPQLENLKYYTFSHFDFDGQKCLVSRTGYTGELGYEIYIPADKVNKLWQVLLEGKLVKPAGLGCRDTLRLEMSYPLYGQDIDTDHSPVAARLDKFVDFSKDFIGKQALLIEKQNGIKEKLVCFKSASRRAPRHGYPIYNNAKETGVVTSGSFSPSLSAGIGMGYVSCDCPAGTELVVGEAPAQVPVTIVEKPFYKIKS